MFGGTGNLRESRPDLTSDRVRFGVRPIVGAALRERDAKEPSQRRSSCSKNKKTTTSENMEMWRRRKRGARETEREEHSGCVWKGALYSNKVRYN